MPNRRAPVLNVTESRHDATFLKRISRVVHSALDEAPNLSFLEAQGKVMFLALGCKVTIESVQRFASLGLPEFHLYCRKSAKEFERRRPIVEALQTRKNCAAFLTEKRSVENYLHRQVVHTSVGCGIAVNDDMDVPYTLARRFLTDVGTDWSQMPRRTRRTEIQSARKWLCTRAPRIMTLALLERRDPRYELVDWLMTIDSMVALQSPSTDEVCAADSALIA